MGEGRVLITGADGYLGGRLARHWLECSDAPLTLWLHAGSPAEFARRQAALVRRLPDAAHRITWGWGDLTAPAPLAGIDPRQVGAIVHAAAVTRFNVDAGTARQVNVEGTAKVLRFARTCPHVSAVGLLSTLYASGLQPGPLAEEPTTAGAGFANSYEWSKWRAERLLLADFADLPGRVLRVATVVADDDSGRVEQHNAFHNTLRLLHSGLLPLLPGDPGTPVYLVTGAYAAGAAAAVLADPSTAGVYHVAPARPDAMALGELVDVAFEAFLASPAFARRRILPPRYADQASFDLLIDGLSTAGGDVWRQAIGSLAPFAPQLFVAKDVCTARLRTVPGTAGEPVTAALVRRACRQLVATRWGRDAG